MKILTSISLFTLLIAIGFTAKAQSDYINKVTASYLDLKDKLVADNAKGAKDAAGKLLTELSADAGKNLSATQKKALATYADKLKFDSRHISETTVIDHQREHFITLSKNMYALVKLFGANTNTLYVQYCPMKSAYWLSDDDNVRNPYYGKSMLSCGSVKGTIKAVSK